MSGIWLGKYMKREQIIQGDCVEEMKKLPENSIDTIITDPPYGLEFMGKEWDYDVPSVKVFKEMLRVAKPGATLLCFGGTRTYHRMACAIEDAGWILKDCIMWLYGQGFPKSHNVANAIDKKMGMPQRGHAIASGSKYHATTGKARPSGELLPPYKARTKEAKKWEGYGSALKPAYEPIVFAMKPNEGTYAQNALKHGVSGLNIDGGRIPSGTEHFRGKVNCNPTKDSGEFKSKSGFSGKNKTIQATDSPLGRFPANIILDEEAAELLDKQSGERPAGSFPPRRGSSAFFGLGDAENRNEFVGQMKDKGGASRFFYVAKAGKAERNMGCENMPDKIGGGMEATEAKRMKTGSGNERNNIMKNNHPTVKPLKLMEYLCMLTKTPTGGIVLDPFGGSGTTGIACKNTGRDYILIEKEKDYCKIAEARIKGTPKKLI